MRNVHVYVFDVRAGDRVVFRKGMQFGTVFSKKLIRPGVYEIKTQAGGQEWTFEIEANKMVWMQID